jgi:hypothetical protein
VHQAATWTTRDILALNDALQDDDITHVWHRLNEVHRTEALHNFLETPQWHAFAATQAYIVFLHAHLVRIHGPSKCFKKGAETMEVSLTAGLINILRGGEYECDEKCLATIHYMKLYMFSLPT